MVAALHVNRSLWHFAVSWVKKKCLWIFSCSVHMQRTAGGGLGVDSILVWIVDSVRIYYLSPSLDISSCISTFPLIPSQADWTILRALLALTTSLRKMHALSSQSRAWSKLTGFSTFTVILFSAQSIQGFKRWKQPTWRQIVHILRVRVEPGKLAFSSFTYDGACQSFWRRPHKIINTIINIFYLLFKIHPVLRILWNHKWIYFFRYSKLRSYLAKWEMVCDSL